MIIIVFGLPGSGKSYFASQLAKMLNADYINSDKIRMAMFVKRTYTINEKLAVYNEMLMQARKAEKNHTNLVLDATFYKNEIREIFIRGVEILEEEFNRIATLIGSRVRLLITYRLISG